MKRGVVWSVAASCSLLAGCGQAAAPGGSAAPDGVAGGEAYRCQEVSVPVTALEDPRSAAELEAMDHPALAALELEEAGMAEPADWWIVSDSDTEVLLLRELTAAEDLGAGDVRTHELLGISVVDAATVPARELDVPATP